MKDKTFNDFWEELKAKSPEIRKELEEAEKNSELMIDITTAVRDLLDEKDSEKWISVDFYLPDTDRKVIVYDTILGVTTGYYAKVFNKEVYRWILSSAVTSNYEPEITHWRELPDPPRMEVQE